MQTQTQQQQTDNKIIIPFIEQNLNIDEIFNDSMRTRIPYFHKLKRITNLVIYDFKKPFLVREYNNTKYIVFKCKIITDLNKDNCFIQIPQLTAFMDLYQTLKNKNLLDAKNLDITIEKINNFHYKITLN